MSNAMIVYDNEERMSAYGGNADSLLWLVHDKIFANKADEIIKVYSNSGEISNVRGDWYTTDENIKDAALEQGYWIIPEPHRVDGVAKFLNLFEADAWEICFTWTQDAQRSPRNGAIHK